MATLTRDQKIAALIIPVLIFGVFGSTKVSAQMRGSLTSEQKTAIEEAHELREAGDYEGARDVLRDAGLDKQFKRGGAAHGERKEKREAIRTAVESGDYDAFVAATEDAPFADMVSEELFEALVRAHELREAGDYEGARDVLNEHGFSHHPKGMHGKKFQRNGEV